MVISGGLSVLKGRSSSILFRNLSEGTAFVVKSGIGSGFSHGEVDFQRPCGVVFAGKEARRGVAL